MKKLLIAATTIVAFAASPALSADLPVVFKAPVAPIPFSWTGCYVGVEGGGAWGRSRAINGDPLVLTGVPRTNDFNLSGGLAGGEVGCNYQVGHFVIGIEDDISWTNKTGTANEVPPFFSPNTTDQISERWLDTLRGRAGFAWDRWFIYGTGGGAWAGTAFSACNAVLVACGANSQTRTGWVAGAGGEWAAWTGVYGALTVKLEYLHIDFGTTYNLNSNVPTVTFAPRGVRLTDDIVRAGLNWKFNWW